MRGRQEINVERIYMMFRVIRVFLRVSRVLYVGGQRRQRQRLMVVSSRLFIEVVKVMVTLSIFSRKIVLEFTLWKTWKFIKLQVKIILVRKLVLVKLLMNRYEGFLWSRREVRMRQSIVRFFRAFSRFRGVYSIVIVIFWELFRIM